MCPARPSLVPLNGRNDRFTVRKVRGKLLFSAVIYTELYIG